MFQQGLSKDMSARYRLFRQVVIALGWLLLGFTVHGAEKVPKEGPLIVAANHRCYADPVFVSMAVPRRLQWMGKKELFIFPFERIFFFLGVFPVDREKGGYAALRGALNLLTAGWALGIFPEGTRRHGGYDLNHTPRRGVGMLATRGGAPVLPVFVGTIPSLLRRLRGGKLHVYIGEPITSHNSAKEKGVYREITDEVLHAIYGLGEKK
jgi:1-acyl-sn-glycerol-3-phosphate acyltransferase